MDFYKVLGVDNNATKEQIDVAYNGLGAFLTKRVIETEKDIADDMLKKVLTAYRVLSDPEERRKYDAWLRQAARDKDNPEEVVRFKNIQGKRYQVVQYADGCKLQNVASPPFCTCCMSPDIKELHSVSTPKILPFILPTTTTTMWFPICPECKEHVRQLSKLVRVATFVPAVAAGLLSGLIRWLSGDLMVGLSIWLPVLFAIGLFLGLCVSLKIERLPMNHSSHGRTVKLVEFSDDKVSYVFENWSYARLFAFENDAEFTEIKGWQRLNKDRLLFMPRAITVPAVVMVFFTGVAILLSSLFA